MFNNDNDKHPNYTFEYTLNGVEKRADIGSCFLTEQKMFEVFLQGVEHYSNQENK